MSSAYQFVNVAMGIWIKERGRVVRSAEPAWTTIQSIKFGEKRLIYARRLVHYRPPRLRE